MRYRYNTEYDPPAPFVDVNFITAKSGRRVGPLSAFIDSGADGTIVPVRYLEQIKAPKTDRAFIRSQWGDRYVVTMYQVDVQIDVLTLRGIEVVGDAISDEIILGRDVLNKLRVLLDGVAQTTDVRS